MASRMSDNLLFKIDEVAELYYRLLLLVAPSGSGKTRALQQLASETGAPLLNLNLEVSKRLLELTERQRALKLPEILQEAVGVDDPLVLLDNIEILFDLTLQQDPLRILQRLSRNRTVVAAWNGTIDGGYLRYATPEHPEYRRYAASDLAIVCPEAVA